MPSQSDEGYIAALYASPDLLRDALKSLAIKYIEIKSMGSPPEGDTILHSYMKASHPAFKGDYQPIEGNGFFMSDPKETTPLDKHKIFGASPKTITLLLENTSREFDQCVRCLASHKADGWYDAIGRNVVAEIDRAYATQDNRPLKALDRVAPILAKLEPPKAHSPPPKGPLL